MRANKLEKPQKTFFFERDNGEIFSTNETEAWGIYRGRNQVVGIRTIPPKIIGVSDGMKMYQAVVEAHEISKTDPEGAKDRLRRGYQEELEVARGRIEIPRNADKMGDGAYLI